MQNVKLGVILAGGKGERLDAQNTIKPLVRVGNKSLIARNIEQMQKVGIEKIFIITGYHADFLKKEILADHNITAEVVFIENRDWQQGMLSSVLSVNKYVENQAFFLSPCDVVFEDTPYLYFSEEDIRFDGVVSLVQSMPQQSGNSGATSRIVIKEDGSISHVRLERVEHGVQTGVYFWGRGSIARAQELICQNQEIATYLQLLECLSQRQLLRINYFNNQVWFDVNTPSVKIRAEMFLRKLPSQKSMPDKLPSYLPKLETFTDFVTEKSVTTDVHVRQGCIDQIDTFELIPAAHASSPHFLITDENVDKLHGERVFQKLRNLGYNLTKIVLPPGEEAKTLAQFSRLAEQILTYGIDEKSILISLGGGTVNNVAGFLASTLYRGIHLIHIPTTLMAQCDAAIGIKQAVNGGKGKNLIGAYFEPLKVIVDPAILLTADERWLRDGLAECIKHAISQSPEFYEFLMSYNGQVSDVNFLENVIKRTIQLKTSLMRNDPKEKAEALVLQYGHTVGHAVEFLSGYRYGHGESVAIGMIAAAQISSVLDIVKDDLVEAHYRVMQKFGLPVSIDRQIRTDDIINAMRYCKRYLYGDVQFVLLDKLGSLWNYNGDYSIPCDNNIITKALNKCYV